EHRAERWRRLRSGDYRAPCLRRGFFRAGASGKPIVKEGPMARPNTAAAVAELTEKLRHSTAAVLTEYRGLTVQQLGDLRTALGEGTQYAVVKTKLSAIAAKEAGLDSLEGQFTGPTAVAFVQGDVVDAAKGLRDLAKASPALVIKGGVLDGAAPAADDVKKRADLESRDVLPAKAAGALKSKISQAASVFAAPASKAVRTIEAL